jgi:hypothetical protein
MSIFKILEWEVFDEFCYIKIDLMKYRIVIHFKQLKYLLVLFAKKYFIYLVVEQRFIIQK